MPSRSEMDTPAMVAAALIGIVLIAVSVPFLDSGSARGTDYAIAWAEQDEASEEGSFSVGSPATLQAGVEDVVPAFAVIEFEPCSDSAQAPLQAAAEISWTLRWEDHEETGEASCADAGPFEVQIEPRPDVAAAEAGSASGARDAAYESAAMNESVTFTLEVTATRGTGPVPLPLPVGQPNFSATARLTITGWHATANEANPEVPR